LLYPFALSVYKYCFLIPSFYWFFNAIHVSLSRICVELMRIRKWRELWIKQQESLASTCDFVLWYSHACILHSTW
jgi:hypothetical protein